VEKTNLTSIPNVRVTRPGSGVALLSLSGAVDTEVAGALLGIVEEEVRDHPRMIVDLGGVSEIGSQVLGALVRALKIARDAGGELVLAGPSAQVRCLLDETGLDTTFRIYENAERALAELKGGK
jgi:anti-sigma B factor antagonist